MSSAPDAILELREADFSYGAESFIRGLGLRLGEGEFVGLLGANGSGKSTVLKLLAGILRPAWGGVDLWGKPLRDYPNRDRAKLLSYLPQTLDMRVPFRVRELVGMGRYPYQELTGPTVEQSAALVGLEERMDALLSELSGGERRRAYIAMTLVQDAGILLLDEPLANLDIRFQLELIRLLRRLNVQRRMSIVMALHDVNLAFQFERLVLIKEGHVLADGPPAAVLTEDLIGEAFGVDVRVVRNGAGSYITYRDDDA